jgi:hypothetical protein
MSRSIESFAWGISGQGFDGIEPGLWTVRWDALHLPAQPDALEGPQP